MVGNDDWSVFDTANEMTAAINLNPLGTAINAKERKEYMVSL